MEMKRKKGLSIIIGLLIMLMLAGYIYVIAGAKHVEKLMWEYLETEGYLPEEVKSVGVYHSFLNPLLSRDRWTIRVRLTDESEAIHLYTVKDGQIDEAAISGNVN
jgi:hypothetical protein